MGTCSGAVERGEGGLAAGDPQSCSSELGSPSSGDRWKQQR